MRRRDLIPPELRALDQWVLWRWLFGRNNKRDKKMFQPLKPGRWASSTDPSTWSSFDDAVAGIDGFDGLAYVLCRADPYTGVDIDRCVLRDGRLHPAAAAIVRQLDSYAELSPSGMGVRLMIRGELPGHRGRQANNLPWGDKLEVYDSCRFLTITGRAITRHRVIHERQQELDAIVASAFPPTPAPRPRMAQQPAGDVHLRLHQALKGSANFRALFAGDISRYGNQSRGDLALARAAAWWTGDDPDQVEWMMRQSALARPKWDERRGETTWIRYTIDTALGT